MSKTLATYLGGSHLYGLNTPESDLDERGIFMNVHPEFILGTKRFDEERNQNSDMQKDLVYREISHLFRLLKNGNTEAIEIMFAPNECFTFLSPEFEYIRHMFHYNCMDSKRLFNCLRGYMQSELKLALGERKGQIGSKRYDSVKLYGYSPKNIVQILRLANLGIKFFQTLEVEVRLSGDFRQKLFNIKTMPYSYSKDWVIEQCQEAEKNLISSYENRKHTFSFDEKLANELLLELYLPSLICK